MKAVYFLYTEICKQCLSVGIDSICDKKEWLVKTVSVGKGKDQGKNRKVHDIHESRMGFPSWKNCYTESMFLIFT